MMMMMMIVKEEKMEMQTMLVNVPMMLAMLCYAKHEFKKNHAKIIQKAIIFQSPTQQAYLITLEILYYEKDRKTILFVISLLKSLTQTIANPQK